MSNLGHFDFNFIRAIEAFAAIVETRHFTQAATMLNLTQSAVSQHLKNLEQATGVRLIDRTVRPIQLTKAGIALHRRAMIILAEVEQLRVDVRRTESAPLPLLRVALLASIATTLTPLIAKLARDDFGIPEVSLFAGLSRDHQNLLRSRRADLAITSDTLYEIDGLTHFPLLSERFLLITPKNYHGPTDDIHALAQQLSFVRFSRETLIGQKTDQHLSRVRQRLPRSLEGDRASIVIAAVAAGIGFTILTPTLLIDGLAEGMAVDVHELPIVSFSREIMLVARAQELDNLPELFAKRCAQHLDSVIKAQLPILPLGAYALLA